LGCVVISKIALKQKFTAWLLFAILFVTILSFTITPQLSLALSPIANAGPDQSVGELTLVTLDGSGSSDPDGDPITFFWTQTVGPAVILSDSTAESPTFTSPAVTSPVTLTFSLIVSDGNINPFAPDTVDVTVLNTIENLVVTSVAGTIAFSTDRVFLTSDFVAESSLPTTGKPTGISFPYGFFSFTIDVPNPGDSAVLTITYPTNMPTTTQYWQVADGTWTDISAFLGSNDGDNVLTLTITDGGDGDADVVDDGIITVPAGGPSPGDDIVLFVSSQLTREILKYDGLTGAFQGVFASTGPTSLPDGLVIGKIVELGPNDNLFVSNRNSSDIIAFDITTGASAFFPSTGLSPTGLVFGPNGNLFVSSEAPSRVVEFDGTTGAQIGTFASTGLALPHGLVFFGPNPDLYVSNRGTNEVIRFGTTGDLDFKGVFASAGLSSPTGLVFGPNGNLFVSSEAPSRVLEFDGTTGDQIRTFASTGLALPHGLVFGPNLDLYVSSRGTNQVIRFGTTGDLDFKGVFASTGLSSPTGLVFFNPTEPTLNPVSITSDNAFDTTKATVGDTITLTFTSSSTIQNVVVTISGSAADSVSNVGNDWTATRVVQFGDTEGTILFTIDFEDILGNSQPQVTETTDTSSVTIDKTAPPAPSITAPTEGSILTDNTPTISGTSEARATIKVFSGTTLIGSTTADGVGFWTLTSSILSEGAHVLTARALDAVGNESGPSAVRNIIINITAPNTAPVANGDIAPVLAKTSTATNQVIIRVLLNDKDVDGDALSISAVTQGTNGAVTTDGSTVIYAPDFGPIDGGTFDGGDSFTYTISDGNLGTDTATVKILDAGLEITCDDLGMLDEDGDFVCDGWEVGGSIEINDLGAVALTNPFVFTCASGCDNTEPDIFVEYDWMTGHEPDPNALQDVIDAFAASSVGTIHLHLERGEDMQLHRDTLAVPGTGDPNGWDQLKRDFFGSSAQREDADLNLLIAKRQIFHYAQFIHLIDGEGTSSGKAEDPGNDFVVSLGGFAGTVGSRDEQAGTFMHELGHNLELHHGNGLLGQVDIAGDGPDARDRAAINCYPNYLSIMTYSRQFSNYLADRPLDYSRSDLADLNEASLVETAGVQASTPAGLKTIHGPAPFKIATTGTGIDWDSSGLPPSGTATNINVNDLGIPGCQASESADIQTLVGRHDWATLNYNMRAADDFSTGAFSFSSSEISTETVEEIQIDVVEDQANTISEQPDSAFAGDPAESRAIIDFKMDEILALVTQGNLDGALVKIQELRLLLDTLIVDPVVKAEILEALDNLDATFVIAVTLPETVHDISQQTFDFAVSASPIRLTVSTGDSASYNIGVSHQTGTPESVSLSVSGLPAGAAASITPDSLTPTGAAILDVSTSDTTPIGTHIITITATASQVTKSATVELVVEIIDQESFFTDSKFSPINSIDVVFTPDGRSGTFQITATNPGTYFYNDILTNTGTSDITLTATLNIPASVDPVLDQAFCLKASNPVSVYSDLARKVDVTDQAVIDPVQPIENTSTQSLTCQSTSSVLLTIPASELRYITTHLDFNGKGESGFDETTQDTYNQGFVFIEDITISVNTQSSPTTLTAVGKRVTAIGGIALDTNLLFKSGLTVQVFDGDVLIDQSGVTRPDGFYIVEVPAGGPYKVQLINNEKTVKTTNSISVNKDQYVQVDFLNINPADPAIEGYVFDSDIQGVSGVDINLYRMTGQQEKLFSSTTTEDGGWYIFRFAQPGTYSVEVIAPEGLAAQPTSETVSLEQFENVRVDFTLIEDTAEVIPEPPAEEPQ